MNRDATPPSVARRPPSPPDAAATSRLVSHSMTARPPRRPPYAGSPARSRDRRRSRRRSARRREDALAVAAQEGDRLGDHREVLLARDAHDLFDVQHRGLADERARGREGLGEDPQPLVRVGLRLSRRRVIPNATISAVSKCSSASSSNSCSSFGLDEGKPASIMCTPSASSACTTRSFSSAVSDMPPPPIPSRRVAS